MSTTSAFTPAERTRSVNILARLASDHDGERAAAGLLACRLLDAKGLRWEDVVLGGAAHRPVPPIMPQSHQQSFRDWRGDAALCMRASRSLTPWEIGFLTDLQTRRKPPTPRQLFVLAGVVAKVQATGGVERV